MFVRQITRLGSQREARRSRVLRADRAEDLVERPWGSASALLRPPPATLPTGRTYSARVRRSDTHPKYNRVGSGVHACVGYCGRTPRQEMGLLPIRAQGPVFYGLVVLGTLSGIALSVLHVNPIKLLILVAVVNGVAAVHPSSSWSCASAAADISWVTTSTATPPRSSDGSPRRSWPSQRSRSRRTSNQPDPSPDSAGHGIPGLIVPAHWDCRAILRDSEQRPRRWRASNGRPTCEQVSKRRSQAAASTAPGGRAPCLGRP